MTKTWCLGGRHYSNTNIITQYEKRNPKTRKLVKIFKGTCSTCGRNNSKNFLSKRLKEKILLKEGNAKLIIVHLCQIRHGVT